MDASITTAENLESQQRLFREFGELSRGLFLVLDSESPQGKVRIDEIPISSSGELWPDRRSIQRRLPLTTRRSMPVRYLTADSLLPGAMREMWDRVLLNGTEERVHEALRILEPDLSDIVFLHGGRAVQSAGRSGVLIRFKNSTNRLPLGSFGDGMRRLLALGLWRAIYWPR